MEIKNMAEAIRKLEEKKGWKATSTKELIKWLQKELAILKTTKDKAVISHQLSDILVLLLQIASREGVDLEAEFKKHLKKSEVQYKNV